jgi:putative FmdB family regulatory protein
MPIFEYQCISCGQTQEKIQHQAVEEIPCPHCGKPAKRQVSTLAKSSSGSAPASSGFT